MPDPLVSAVEAHLDALCAHEDRRIGGPGNHAAVDHAEAVLAAAGFAVESTPFASTGWEPGPALLEAGGRAWPVHGGPYSTPCDLRAPLAVAATLGDLERDGLAGSILLLHGDVVAEQLPPKGFPFYEAPELRRILAAIEAAAPAAVVAATGRNPGFAGSLYPFPLIEDAEVEIPHAYLRDVDGAELLAHAGSAARLRMESRRVPATGRQLVARRGAGPQRVVVFAHVDSKQGSPGGIDNASGVAVLLGLADELRDHAGPPRVELVPLNGEDDFATPGEKLYVAANEGAWDDIVLGINLDAAGAVGGATAISLYGVDEELAGRIRSVAGRHAGIVEGEPWFESDHGLFLLNGVPALAITSTTFRELCATVTHTERDTRELADPAAIAAIARFLADLVAALAEGLPRA